MRKSIKGRQRICAGLSILAAIILTAGHAGGEDKPQMSNTDLAKAVQNPVANMISLPFQNNTDFGIGPQDQTRNTLNIQPVVPFKLTSDWMLITRTIAPVLAQPHTFSNSGSVVPSTPDSAGVLGLGDINTTIFLSPAQPSKIIWGVGPILSFPTATNEVLGTEKWNAGPAAVVMIQPHPWTLGFLVNNMWSYAGSPSRQDVNQMSLQYFINYNLPDAWFLTSAPILTANWKAGGGDQWTVPVGGGVGKVFRIGTQPMNASVQAYYIAIAPDSVPAADWQLRIQLGFLFPK